MPRIKKAFEEMRENTRKKIEVAAVTLFARKGLSVTVDEIARFAGLSKGLLYNHYSSKEALIAELARQATEISGQSIKACAQSEGSAVQKIKQITDVMCNLLQSKSIGIENFMFMIQVGMSDFQLPEESRYSDSSPDPLSSLAQIVAQGQVEGTVVKGESIQLSVTYWAAIQGLCCYAAAGMPTSASGEMLNRILLKEDFI